MGDSILSPAARQAVNNSNIAYDNRQIIMNNAIHTTQTAQAVSNELVYAQDYAFSFV